MTELIINGVRAVLSSDFAVTVKQENPFITKNGEYTYDCTMSLLNPINANLYSFLQRINKREAFATDRRVILIADNRVYCDGTEVITKWTDTKVTIQIVSGNSQFNYFIGSDKKISELDLGRATVDIPTINQSIYNAEELGYAFPPIKIADTIYNDWEVLGVDEHSGSGDPNWREPSPFAGNGFRAIPFALAMVDKILTALGYTIGTNQLKSTDYKYMLLFHNQDTVEFAKMFPGWTCKEFLEEIEKLFNVVFYINYKTKNVDIYTQAKFYGTADMVHVKNVKDDFEMDIEDKDSSEEEHSTSNIGYGFPDTVYYNERRLPEAILKMANNKSMTYNDALAYVQGDSDTGMELFTDPNTQKQYIRTRKDNVDSLLEVNEYKNLIQDTTTDEIGIELDIVPAQIEKKQYKIGFTDHNYALVLFFYNVVVMSEASTDSSTDTAQTTLIDWIEKGGYDKSEESKNIIYAAYYTGPSYTPPIKQIFGGMPEFVQAWTENDDIAFLSEDKHTVLNYRASFRIETLKSDLYMETYAINRKHKLTIESYDVNIYDPRLLFEIKNKRYICESIEYALDSKGRKGTWKGIFYPVDISDTDAEHLWILADGRWRDNGVWVDNGRWLDN